MRGLLLPLLMSMPLGCSLDRSGLGSAGPADGSPMDVGVFIAAADGDPVEPRDGAIVPGDDSGRLDASDGEDAGGVDASVDSDAGPRLGCVPRRYVEVFRDDFGGGLSAWQLDANSGSSATWGTSAGSLRVSSPSVGSDALVDRPTARDLAAAALVETMAPGGASELGIAGVVVRATEIDFATNLFYFCGFDPVMRAIMLARYDEETRVGSGQGFTELDSAPLAAGASAQQLITVCVAGDAIVCELPDTGIRLSATDTRQPDGRAGLRIMRSSAIVDWFAIFEP